MVNPQIQHKPLVKIRQKINIKRESDLVDVYIFILLDGVDCGGYRMRDCASCILYPILNRYLWFLWCRGDCSWNPDTLECEFGM